MQSRVYSVEEVHVEALMVIPENPPAISVSARGWVPTSGWSHPDLAPWMYIVPPKDGILDLDFVASPPTGGFVLQVFSRIGVVKAFPIPSWVRGVRIHTSTNRMEAMLEKSSQKSIASAKEGPIAGPWPFPWYAPKAKPL
jgi:hypothetical protein